MNDSNNDGISDGDDDADNDGLTNAEETLLGTNPAYFDSDYDYLSDYDEVNKYHTDPLNPDSDNDGVPDGKEVQNNSDPLVKESVFETEVSVGTIDADNPVSVSAKVTTDNIGAGTLDIKEVSHSDNALISILIPGRIGSAYDFSAEGEFISAQISFSYDESLGDIGDDFQPRIYYVNEETGEFEELEDQIVENGVVTATVSHFSTYILLNEVEFDTVWDTEIKPSDYEGDSKKGLDIVFALDSSGSMWSNDYNGIRREAVKQFVDKLGENDRAAVVDFDDYSYVVQSFTSDHALLYNAVDMIDDDGGTSLSEGMSTSIDLFTGSGYTRKDAYKYIVFLTDGEGDYSDSYTAEAYNNGIVVYTVGLGEDVQEYVLKEIADGTGGKYYFASQSNQLLDIYSDVSVETVDYVTDSNNDGISDYYTNLIDSGKLLPSNGAYDYVGVIDMYGEEENDWDGDGLLNGEEIEIVTSSSGKTYIRVKSNPLLEDTDGDYINDYTEIKTYHTDPLRYTKYGGTSVDSFVNDDDYICAQAFSQKDIVISISGLFDWQKTKQSKETYINYFYDYASEKSINSAAKAREELAKREKAWETIENIVSILKITKDIVDIGTNLSSYDSAVKGQVTKYNNLHKDALSLYNKKDYDAVMKSVDGVKNFKEALSILSDVRDLFEESDADKLSDIILEKIAAFTSGVSTIVKSVSVFEKWHCSIQKVNGFSRHYQTWLGKRPAGDVSLGTVVSVGIDVVNFVTDVADLANLYGKLQANSEAFNEYIELIEYVSNNAENKYTRVAAGDIVKIVLDKSNTEYYKQLIKAIEATSREVRIKIALSIAGDFCPYVKVAKLVIDIIELSVSLSGMTDYAQCCVQSQAIYALSNGCNYYLSGLYDVSGEWYSFDNHNSETMSLYLTQLAQSRIVGEDNICNMLKKGSIGNTIVKWAYNLTNKEIDEKFMMIINPLYTNAERLNLQLSNKLPHYPDDYTPVLILYNVI
ncbi:MAG: VWA domain-containing protein [Clostridia bacterium]|nr:VWA domain-containing protein [Clostridia bacterium]